MVSKLLMGMITLMGMAIATDYLPDRLLRITSADMINKLKGLDPKNLIRIGPASRQSYETVLCQYPHSSAKWFVKKSPAPDKCREIAVSDLFSTFPHGTVPFIPTRGVRFEGHEDATLMPDIDVSRIGMLRLSTVRMTSRIAGGFMTGFMINAALQDWDGIEKNWMWLKSEEYPLRMDFGWALPVDAPIGQGFRDTRYRPFVDEMLRKISSGMEVSSLFGQSIKFLEAFKASPYFTSTSATTALFTPLERCLRSSNNGERNLSVGRLMTRYRRIKRRLTHVYLPLMKHARRRNDASFQRRSFNCIARDSYSPNRIALIICLGITNVEVFGGSFTNTDYVQRAMGAGVLLANDILHAGEKIVSPNELYRFEMQLDGNGVVYDSAGNALWSTANSLGWPADWSAQGRHLKMQDDGNAVIYNRGGGQGSGNAHWASNTNRVGRYPHEFAMQDDGNLVLYDADNVPTWASGTNR